MSHGGKKDQALGPTVCHYVCASVCIARAHMHTSRWEHTLRVCQNTNAHIAAENWPKSNPIILTQVWWIGIWSTRLEVMCDAWRKVCHTYSPYSSCTDRQSTKLEDQLSLNKIKVIWTCYWSLNLMEGQFFYLRICNGILTLEGSIHNTEFVSMVMSCTLSATCSSQVLPLPSLCQSSVHVEVFHININLIFLGYNVDWIKQDGWRYHLELWKPDRHFLKLF